MNTLTASTPRGAVVPPVVETDRAGLVASRSMIGTTSPETVRVVRVQDTMRLRRVQVSEALLAEARDRPESGKDRSVRPAGPQHSVRPGVLESPGGREEIKSVSRQIPVWSTKTPTRRTR